MSEVAGGAQARKVTMIYAADERTEEIIVTIGDSIRGEDWAAKQYPDDVEQREARGGLYAVYLAARRAGLAGTDGDWLEWLDLVTMPDDEDDEKPEAPAPGESQGLSREA